MCNRFFETDVTCSSQKKLVFKKTVLGNTVRSVNDGLSGNLREFVFIIIRSGGNCLGFLQVAGGFTDNPSLTDQTDLLEITESVPYSMYFYNTSEEQTSGEAEDLPDLKDKDVQMVAKKMQLAFRSKFPKPMVKIEERSIEIEDC